MDDTLVPSCDGEIELALSLLKSDCVDGSVLVLKDTLLLSIDGLMELVGEYTGMKPLVLLPMVFVAGAVFLMICSSCS